MRITVEVKTESQEESITKIGENHYSVRVKAARKKGKANAELLKMLRRHFGATIAIVSGHKSTVKIIEIESG
jgi:uncharacterized protein (TIGR00251 family)